MSARSNYPLRAERVYGTHPRRCRSVDVLIVGSAVGLSSARYLFDRHRSRSSTPLRIAVADSGPMDLLTHFAHTNHPRGPHMHPWTPHFGGRLGFWGMSTPRPPEDILRRWPYDYAELLNRFNQVEAAIGVLDPVPKSGGNLELHLLSQLRDAFPGSRVGTAPLAIDKDGGRYSSLDEIPDLVRDGVRLLPQFHCTRLVKEGVRVAAVQGRWVDGRTHTLRPRVVVLATGVEPSLPLVRQVADGPLALDAADHIRIDLHGKLPARTFGRWTTDESGVAILIMDCRSREFGVPYHLEIKAAPLDLWRRGYMQSSDNLHGSDDPDTLYVQVQAVCAMHDRLPSGDLLRVQGPLPPVMSARDAAFHGEVIETMRAVAAAIGLPAPAFCLRPLLTNHHTYGAYRVGKAVSREFLFRGTDNLYVLPPTAFVDEDDDANPTLKSLVLSRFAMDHIAERFAAEVTDAASVSAT
ncbi:MAG TPA: hypothetical protein VD866_10420 [Urbifossiella sp.]|nr:hypothetical protein [Urbifossiella sp.]